MQSDIKLPDGWVFQDKVPARPRVDYGYWVAGGCGFSLDSESWWPIAEDRHAGKLHGYMDFDHSTLYVMCRVEDYPSAESPDDVVIQDRVPARVDLDYAWWRFPGDLTTPDISDCISVFPGSYPIGRRHGYVDYDHSVLNLYCRRRDYPAPAESPDDWVPQKSVPGRSGIDQRRYVKEDGSPVCLWCDCAVMEWGRPVLFGAEVNDTTVELRCLRKHHPDYQAKAIAAIEPQSFRICDTVRFRGGMITFLVAWVAKDGMVRLADQSNPAYWCNPAVLELVSRSEGPYQW